MEVLFFQMPPKMDEFFQNNDSYETLDFPKRVFFSVCRYLFVYWLVWKSHLTNPHKGVCQMAY